MNLAPGDIFEQRYEVREELTGDDFGVLYRATALDTGREVVLRIVLPPAQGYPAGFGERFMGEAKLAGRLRHPGSVHVEAFGASADGSYYLVTELVSGPTLAQVIADEEVPHRDALGLGKRLADSLAEGHDLGLVHRELRPSSILVPLRRGILGAKLGDWALTRAVENESPLAGGTGLGNPRYMSPEQVLGEPLTAASNIYSLGLVLFELVTKTPCISASSSREILATHLSTTEFELPASVPPAIAPVLRRMIAKSRADRFQTAHELRDALAKVDESQLGLTVQMKVARMVEALEASEDSRGAEDTIVDPRLFEPDSGERTKERYNDPPTEVEASFEALLNFVPADDEPTNIVAEATLADESSVPDALTLDEGAENEPTDEVKSKKRPASRKKSERPARRAPPAPAPPQPAEERVSGWAAVGAIVGAVLIAVAATATFLYFRANTTNTPGRVVRTQIVAPTNPSIVANPSPLVLPAVVTDVEVDLGGSLDPVGEIQTGCGIERTAGWSEQSEVVGLTEFSYHTYVPASYTGQPVPVVLIAHAPNGYRRGWSDEVGLSRLADEFGAILLMPVDRSLRPWVKDLAGSRRDFERVLQHASETFCVDQRRVFGVGMSTGAYALQRFACAEPDRFRGVALVASWATARKSCPGPRRTATLLINGLADRVSPPEGGPGCWGGDVRLSLDDYVADLAELHGCTETREWAKEADGTCSGYSDCSAELVTCRVPEAAHIWPGAIESEVRCIDRLEGSGNGGKNFPTADVIRRFFEQLVTSDTL